MTLLNEMWPSEMLQGLKALLRQFIVEKTYAYGSWGHLATVQLAFDTSRLYYVYAYIDIDICYTYVYIYIYRLFILKGHWRLALWDHGQTLKQVGCWQSQNWPSGNYPRTLCFDTRPEAFLLLRLHTVNCWHMQRTLAARACNSSHGKVSSSRFRAVPLATPRQGHCLCNCHVRVLASGNHLQSFCSPSILHSTCPRFWHVFTWQILKNLKAFKDHALAKVQLEGMLEWMLLGGESCFGHWESCNHQAGVKLCQVVLLGIEGVLLFLQTSTACTGYFWHIGRELQVALSWRSAFWTITGVRQGYCITFFHWRHIMLPRSSSITELLWV